MDHFYTFERNLVSGLIFFVKDKELPTKESMLTPIAAAAKALHALRHIASSRLATLRSQMGPPNAPPPNQRLSQPTTRLRAARMIT